MTILAIEGARLRVEARAVLLDIEGTLSSITQVRDEMVPYARARLPDFLSENGARPEVAALLDATRALDGGARPPLDVLLEWIDTDRKAPPLKKLQALIWAKGFADGDLKGHVYDDALAAMRNWRALGLPLWIYSSGTVATQLDFFRHNIGGDLTDLFAGHFDTDVGAKTDPTSYAGIAAAIGARPPDLLFFSDAPAEVRAARSSGLLAVRIDRDGIGDASDLPTIPDFTAVDLSRRIG